MPHHIPPFSHTTFPIVPMIHDLSAFGIGEPLTARGTHPRNPLLLLSQAFLNTVYSISDQKHREYGVFQRILATPLVYRRFQTTTCPDPEGLIRKPPLVAPRTMI